MKLTQEDVDKLVRRVVDYGLRTAFVAEQFGVTQRRVQQLVKHYRETGKPPVLKRPGRKPCSRYSENLRNEVLWAKAKLKCSATGIAAYLRRNKGIKVDNNVVHKILLEEGLAVEEPNKKGRKRPWVRYERKHALSAVHMDWFYHNGRWVVAVLDDCSRMILAAKECDRRSVEVSIVVLEEAINRYKHIRMIREVITDHGSEFYANKRDKKGRAKHRFEEFCKANGVKHILCKYNHPQSNGKIEKWIHTYKRFRDEFESLEEFLHWYNYVRPHRSLDWRNLETPAKRFYESLRPFILGNFMSWVEKEVST